MRHGKKDNHLGRTASHRKAMLSNMANSLILHKRITTTLAKAKELRKYVEPILTKSKDDTTHNRRTAFAYLKNKEAIKVLFGEISEKIANRNGGYTRIIKLGTRSGDAAETALIELVDYNELLLTTNTEAPTKSRRTRRAGSKKGTEGIAAAEVVETITNSAPEETSPVTDEVVDEPQAEISEDIQESPSTDSGSETVEAKDDEKKEE
jgi:large subunit ribosomal protein L17